MVLGSNRRVVVNDTRTTQFSVFRIVNNWVLVLSRVATRTLLIRNNPEYYLTHRMAFIKLDPLQRLKSKNQ